MFKACVVGVLEAVVHHRFKIAGVVDRAVGGFVGHGAGRNKVFAAQCDCIKAMFVRRVIDQPLDRIRNVGPARAAVGGNRHGVGEHQPRAHVNRRDFIHAARGDGDVARGDEGAESTTISAEIATVIKADGEQLAVSIEGEFAGQ